MIIFRDELPIDHENSLTSIVDTWAKEIYFGDFDFVGSQRARDDAWSSLMQHLLSEDLHAEVFPNSNYFATITGNK